MPTVAHITTIVAIRESLLRLVKTKATKRRIVAQASVIEKGKGLLGQPFKLPVKTKNYRKGHQL